MVLTQVCMFVYQMYQMWTVEEGLVVVLAAV